MAESEEEKHQRKINKITRELEKINDELKKTRLKLHGISGLGHKVDISTPNIHDAELGRSRSDSRTGLGYKGSGLLRKRPRAGSRPRPRPSKDD